MNDTHERRCQVCGHDESRYVLMLPVSITGEDGPKHCLDCCVEGLDGPEFDRRLALDIGCQHGCSFVPVESDNDQPSAPVTDAMVARAREARGGVLDAGDERLRWETLLDHHQNNYDAAGRTAVALLNSISGVAKRRFELIEDIDRDLFLTGHLSGQTETQVRALLSEREG